MEQPKKINPLVLLAVLLLGIFIGVAGGAVSGGAAALYITGRHAAVSTAIQPILTSAGAVTLPAQPAPQGSDLTAAASDNAVAAVRKVGPAVVTVLNHSDQGSGSVVLG